MAESFYQTDLFIREVTDSGQKATGGISSRPVRQALQTNMQRHERLSIPQWIMTYFGFSLLENVERQCNGLTTPDKRLHLAYMTKTYRVMGIPFSEDRDAMEQFGRLVEKAHAGPSPHLEKHAHNILVLGEMVGVSSQYERISSMLEAKTRELFEEIYQRVRPSFFERLRARILGRLLMKQALGEKRKAVPVDD